MRTRARRENYLGITGWVWGGRYQIERYLYILHRVTGLGLVLYGIVHLLVMTVFRMQGEDFYGAVMRVFEYPVFKVGEYLVFAALIFHGLNGARLVFQELGFLLGKPRPPIYPYKDSLRRRRPLVLAMIALAVVLAALVLFDFARGAA